MLEKIEAVREFLKKRIGDFEPELLVVLGSGLSFFSENIEDPFVIDYKEIPHFPQSTVPGHAGKLIFGEAYGRKVMVMSGRFHLYEGYDPKDVVLPVYVAKRLGACGVLLTNAAGAINPFFKPGDIVLVKDIVNFMFRNPLRGPNDERIGPRFPDMSEAVDKGWVERVKERLGDIKEGVYIGVLGPSYETPAEIKAFSKLGADLVGMSTVPEVIAAKHCGMKVLVISCVTNMAAGISEKKLSHKEVIDTMKASQKKIEKAIAVALEVF